MPTKVKKRTKSKKTITKNYPYGLMTDLGLSRHCVFVWIVVGAVSAEWPLREAAAMRHKGMKIREKETRRQCRFGKIKTEEKNKGKNFSAFRIKILTLWQ